jgi:hypothetical protein
MNESFRGKKNSGLKDRINALIKKKKESIKELQPWTKKGEYKDLTKGAIRDLEAQTKKLEGMLKNMREWLEFDDLEESVHEKMWIDIFKAIDKEKDFKRFNVKKVADTNKLVKFLRFQLPMGPKTAMTVATTYGDYRAGRTKLEKAAKQVAKDLKKFQMKEETIDEVLTKSDPKEKWIDDFIKSDAPQFKGKTKKERINMALAAFRAKQNEEKELEEKKKFNFDKDDKDKDGLDDVDKGEVKKDFKDREDKDIDNDGDTDKSDKYLHKRRKAISKAIAKKAK